MNFEELKNFAILGHDFEIGNHPDPDILPTRNELNKYLSEVERKLKAYDDYCHHFEESHMTIYGY